MPSSTSSAAASAASRFSRSTLTTPIVAAGPDRGGEPASTTYSGYVMISFLFRRWRRRTVLRAWAKGDLEFAGAVGWRSGLQRRV